MNLSSRKFLAAMFVLIVSAVALFTGIVDGGTWVAISSIALGLYGAGNVGAALVAKRQDVVVAIGDPVGPATEGNENGEA